MFLFSNFAQAKDGQYICSLKKPKKTFSGIIMSVTGMNFISKNIIENVISSIIKKETNSKVKIKLSGFFGSNILKGEFRELKANAKTFSYDEFYFSNLDVKTRCSYNHISLVDKEVKINEDLILDYSLDVTQDDLVKITNSDKYKKIIEKMNSDKAISAFLQIKESNFEIRKNKLYLKYTVIPSAKNDIIALISKNIKPIKISIGADLKVVDGKIELCNLTSSKYVNFAPIINRLNPLLYDFEIDENNKGELKIKFVEIKENKIHLKGEIFIPKNK